MVQAVDPDALRRPQHRKAGHRRRALRYRGDGDPAQSRSRARLLESAPLRVGAQSEITRDRGHRVAGPAAAPGDPDRADPRRRVPDRNPRTISDMASCLVAEPAGFAIHRRRLLLKRRRNDHSGGGLNTRRERARTYDPASQPAVLVSKQLRGVTVMAGELYWRSRIGYFSLADLAWAPVISALPAGLRAGADRRYRGGK